MADLNDKQKDELLKGSPVELTDDELDSVDGGAGGFGGMIKAGLKKAEQIIGKKS